MPIKNYSQTLEPYFLIKQIRTQTDIINQTKSINLRILYASGSQTFSHHEPFVGPILSPRTTLLQENSIYQISFDQKFGKPELTQMRREDNGSEK